MPSCRKFEGQRRDAALLKQFRVDIFKQPGLSLEIEQPGDSFPCGESIVSRSLGCDKSVTMFSARASGSRSGERSPVRPCSTASGMPPWRVPMTGTPTA